MHRLEPPYLLFLGEGDDPLDIKTARGIHQWRPSWCLGELPLHADGPTLGLERMTPAAAAERGARTLVVGTVNPGGRLPDAWLETLRQAVDAGLHVAAGMHRRLRDIAPLRDAAQTAGVQLVDVREPPADLAVGTGEPRAGRRILTVGTDCSVGKMYTSLALEHEMRQRGWNAHFKATGQTGILIAGEGIPVDAVVADFISGAVEALSPAAPGAWHLIEGQGSLRHPAFAGVTLGLIHGAQPDYLVVCHEPTRPHMRHAKHFVPPSPEEIASASLEAARLTNQEVCCLGYSFNTSGLPEDDARRQLEDLADRTQLPAVDPVRWGVAALVDHLEALHPPEER